MYTNYYLIIGFVLQLILGYLVVIIMDFNDKYKEYSNSNKNSISKLLSLNNEMIRDIVNYCIIQYNQKGNAINLINIKEIRVLKNSCNLFLVTMFIFWIIFFMCSMHSNDIDCMPLIALLFLFVIIFVIINLNNIKKFFQLRKVIK